MQILSQRIPSQENEGSIIDRLRLYIDPVDSTWYDSLKPASEEQIAELSRTLDLDRYGLQLPAIFVEFLRYAGEGAGKLFMHTLYNVEMSVSSFGKKLYINEMDSMGPYCFDIFMHYMGVTYSMNLGERDQKIIYEADWVVSDSFENLVFQCAVESYEYKYFRFFQGFAVSPKAFPISEIGNQYTDLFDYLHELAEQYHLQEAWFNDSCFYFAYSDEFSFKVRRSENGGFRGFICSNDKKIAEELERVLLVGISAEMDEIVDVIR